MKNMHFASRRAFSLLELLTATAISVLLFAVALGAYREQTLRMRRADARNALLYFALQQEEYLLRHNHYSDSLLELRGGSQQMLSAHGHYRLRLNEADAECAAEPDSGKFFCYTLTAHPVAGQRRDKHCAVFWLHHDGRRGAGAAVGVDAAGCW